MVEFPGYTILRPLGRGGMATVYLARQESLGREIALKVLATTSQDDATAHERFLREARIAASLRHPHIVPIHDFGLHGDLAYIAMEYQPGGTVAPLAGEKLPPREALRIVRDIAGALDYAHGRGVVHRDIKPDNILRGEHGGAVLTDFGIARLQGASVLTAEGTSVGTPLYMSPEQLRGDKVDGRSDLYSLGVVLWQLLTGDPPYSGHDAWSIGTQHITAAIPRLPPALAHLQPLLDDLLAKQPEARLQSGAELVQRIDAMLATTVTPDTVPAAPVHVSPATGSIPENRAVDRRAAAPAFRNPALLSPRKLAVAAAGALLLAAAAGAWWLRPQPAAPHGMMVRLAGFRMLSADLPTTTGDTVDAEITAAFNADGVVGVSNAAAPPSGSAPAYALGGTVQRDGETIRVITRLSNERSGATLWTNNFNYDGNESTKVPRHIAIDAGNVVRCGLFGASTYAKPLPDAVLRDYMQFCQGYWDPYLGEGHKSLVPAQRVVAAVPDFSWGWAAVAGAYWKVAGAAATPESAKEARSNGRQAADRAIAIDPKNSEALYIKSLLVDSHDWLGRETLLKRAVEARRLDCGCEHHQYGWMLANVGRIGDALDQLRRANDMLALYVYTPLTLADALVAAGKPEEARRYYDAAVGLAPDARFARRIAAYGATMTGDTGVLLDPGSAQSAEVRAAFLAGDRAMASADPGAKARAVQALVALPRDQQDEGVTFLLAGLGADHAAFELATRLATRGDYPGASIFWYRSMRGALADPGFPAVAEKLGLMDYWRKAGVRPDVCKQAQAPPFCQLI